MPSEYQMLSCIREIPAALQRTITENEDKIKSLAELIRENKIRRLVITGVGSSFTAAVIASPILNTFPTLPVIVLPPTDLYAYNRLLNPDTVVVAVSRSGERGWVVNALKETAKYGATGVAMTANPNSPMLEYAKISLLTREGPEMPFPKTKSVATCADLLMYLGLSLADPSDGEARDLLSRLMTVPDELQTFIEFTEPQVTRIMPEILTHNIIQLGGTVSNYGVALEIALKLQEAAHVPTICWDTGNLFHGPWGPHNEKWLLALMVGYGDLEISQKALQLAGKLGAHRLAIIEPGIDLRESCEYTISLPSRVNTFLAGLYYLPPMQLLTYYWAVSRGLNPDRPSQMPDVLNAMLLPGRQEHE